MAKDEGKCSVCIPTLGPGGLDDFVSDHFGQAPTFTVVDLATNAVQVIENRGEHFGGRGVVPELLAEAGAEILLCSGLGPRAIGMFAQLGIAVYVGACGTVREALSDFHAGRLKAATEDTACTMHRH